MESIIISEQYFSQIMENLSLRKEQNEIHTRFYFYYEVYTPVKARSTIGLSVKNCRQYRKTAYTTYLSEAHT